MPEMAMKVLKGNERMRCLKPGCGVWHDCYPEVTRGGETKLIISTRCAEHTQQRLDSGDPLLIERFDDTPSRQIVTEAAA